MNNLFGLRDFISGYFAGGNPVNETAMVPYGKSTSSASTQSTSSDSSEDSVLDENLSTSESTHETVVPTTTLPDSDIPFSLKLKNITVPGILSCGHFFELQLLDDYRNRCVAKKQDFVCPEGCGKVEDKIMKTNQLQKAIEKNEKQIQTITDNLKEITDLKSQIDGLKVKDAALEEKVKLTRTRANVAKVIYDEAFENNLRIRAIFNAIKNNGETLRKQNKVKSKQVENSLKQPSLLGAFNYWWCPASVVNKDITDDKMAILNKTVLSKEKIKELSDELEKKSAKQDELLDQYLPQAESSSTESSYSISTESSYSDSESSHSSSD